MRPFSGNIPITFKIFNPSKFGCFIDERVPVAITQNFEQYDLESVSTIQFFKFSSNVADFTEVLNTMFSFRLNFFTT